MYGPQLSGPLASLEDLSLAWAVTVHKSQGSEYPVVLLPVSKWHHKLLR
jgi:exodeoxyribonuclease V alpha subunit